MCRRIVLTNKVDKRNLCLDTTFEVEMNVIFKMNCVCFLKTTDLFNILHPLGHLGVAHVVDILDEGVILLPERHLLAVGVLKQGQG